MPRNTVARCSTCLGVVIARGPDIMRHRLDNHRFGEVEFYFHLGCADTDPLYKRLADALSMADGIEADQAAAAVYLALRDRIAMKAPARLPDAIRIVRDTAEKGHTLKAPPPHWGRLVRITRADSPIQQARRERAEEQ